MTAVRHWIAEVDPPGSRRMGITRWRIVAVDLRDGDREILAANMTRIGAENVVAERNKDVAELREALARHVVTIQPPILIDTARRNERGKEKRA